MHDACPPSQTGPTAPLPPLPPLTVKGHTLRSVLGVGGFGLVMLANQDATGAPVAVKFARTLPALGVEKLKLEARILEAVRPPHAPQLIAEGTTAEGSYVVMELMTHPLLATRLEQQPAGLEVATFERWSRGLCHAVQAVHAAGFVHCDLKPENIFLDDSGETCLIDFGIARRIGQPEEVEAVVGTSEYMAPEQCGGRARLDERADIYALGVVFYELLTGRVPFIGTSGRVIEFAHVARRPPLPSSFSPVPPALEAVVLRCLAKEPADRYANVGELQAALSEALVHAGGARPSQLEGPQSKVTPPKPPQPALGLLCFEPTADAALVDQAVASLGGAVASMQGARWVAVFSPEGSENPVVRAIEAAETMLKRNLMRAAMVHLARVSVSTRRGGGKRYLSPLFTNADCFPRPGEQGLLLTRDAVGVAAANGEVGLVRDNVYRLTVRPVVEELTTVGRAATALMGREADLEAQLSLFARVERTGIPQLSVVLGEPGLGKSLFSAELASRLRSAAGTPEVVHLRARESLGDSSQLLRALVQRLSGLDLETVDRGALARELGVTQGTDAELAVSVALGWLAPTAPELGRLGAAPGVLIELAVRSLSELFRVRAAHRPYAIVLDDGHLADRLTLDLLHSVTLPERQMRVFACVVARAQLAVHRPAWCAGARRLEKLGLADASALVRVLLMPAQRVPQASVEWLVRRAEGIPLLLVELIGALKREGLVRRQGEGGRSWYLASEELDRLPDIPVVQWSAERDLKTLSDDLVAHAQLTALLGGEVRAVELEGVLRQLDASGAGAPFPLDARVGLNRLVGAGVLVKHRDETFDFRTGVLRDAVTATAGELAPAVHAAAVAFYRTSSLPEAERLPKLARHAAATGLADLAGTLNLALADQARARHAYLEAERGYTRALETLPSTRISERLAAQRYRGQMRFRTGRFEGSVADLTEAAGLAEAAEDLKGRVEALLIMATTLDWMGDYARSRDLIRQVEPLAVQVEDDRIVGELELGRGRSAWRFNEFEAARVALTRAIDVARRVGEPAYETHIDAWSCLAPLLVQLGEREQARQAFDSAIALAKSHEDRLHLGGVVQNRLMLWLMEHDGERALADTRQFLQIVRELGVTEGEVRTEYNLGELMFQMDRLDEALAHVGRSIDLAEQLNVNTSSFRSMTFLLKARILLYRGDLSGARAIVDTLRAESMKSSGAVTLTLEGDEMYARMIELASSPGLNDAAWQHVQDLAGRVGVTQDPLEIAEARARHERQHGRLDRAQALLEQALADGKNCPNLMLGRLGRQLETVVAARHAVA